MNIQELQIQFQQKIQDINKTFEFDERPDSYSIVNYLNKGINLYINDKYLSLPTYEQRLVLVDQNLDELNELITSDGNLYHEVAATNYNWGSRAKRYRLPDDCLFPISLTVTVTRTEVLPMINQLQFVEFVSRRQAERIISDTSDKVIHPKPVAFIDDEYYVMVVGDSYVSSITASKLVYLRKPYTLSLTYSELTNTDATIDISSIADNSYFRPMSSISYYDGSGVASFTAGSKVKKLAGYDSVTVVAVSNVEMKVGFPWGETNVPDLAPLTHMKLVDLAVQLFVDEAKLKLVPKQSK